MKKEREQNQNNIKMSIGIDLSFSFILRERVGFDPGQQIQLRD